MGSPRLAFRDGILAAALLLTPALYAPPAHAADSADGGREVAVTPQTPAAGAEVALRVSGCTGKTAKAVSDAFVSDARLAGSDGQLIGESKVRSTAGPGAYDVRITCADFEIKGKLTVVGPPKSGDHHSGDHHSGDHSGRPEHASPAPYSSPVAPVHAGGGGTAKDTETADGTGSAGLAKDTRSLADADPEARSEGPGTAHAVTGLALAALAAAAIALRGARRRRGGGAD